MKLVFKHIIIFIFLPVIGLSQITFPEADRETYRFYTEQKWDSLLIAGKEALKQDIDYFYLRTRMGTAWYELGKPVKAARQFRKARDFNASDTYNNASLYYSLLNANQTGRARAISSTIPEGEQAQLGIRKNILRDINLEVGIMYNNAYTKSDPTSLMDPDSIFGEQDMYGNSYYGHLDFTLNLTKHISLNIGYSYLNFKKRNLYQYSYFDDQLERRVDTTWGYYNIYSFPRITKQPSFNYVVNQNELTLSPAFFLNSGFSIKPMFHLVQVSYNNTTVNYSTETVQDTALYIQAIDSAITFPFNRQSYRVSQSDTSFFNYLISLLITKDINLFTFGLTGSWSNLNGRDQYQVGFVLDYYPLGNLNFYGNTTLFKIFEQTTGNRLIARQMLGAKVTKWLWLEGSFIYGDYSNGNLFNGILVYNMSDKIRYSATGKLIFPIFKQLEVTLIYQYFARENLIYTLTEVQEGSTTTVVPQNDYMKYQTNSVFLGIKWKL